MINKLTDQGRQFAFKHNMLTASVVVVISLVIYLVFGFANAKSALVGGLVALVPNIVFAYKAFQYAGAQSSKKVVESFFSGVKLKMVLTALLFALTFKFIVLLPLPFFALFCLVMAMPLITPIIIKQ